MKTLCIGLLVCVVATAASAQAPTSTPAPVDLSGAAGQQPQFSAPPTATRTPTETPPAVLQPRESANVRAEPSTDASILGVIRAGEVYNVTGRYFEWLQFQYPNSPNGRGWVFGQLVDITGDLNAIPEIDLSAQPTLDPLVLGATETLAAITLTPGGLLTATANARQIAAPPGAGGAALSSDSGAVELILPTFTYPAGVVFAPTPLPDTAPNDEPASAPRTDDSGGLPPIVPIMVLGGIGVLGLAISSVRR